MELSAVFLHVNLGSQCDHITIDLVRNNPFCLTYFNIYSCNAVRLSWMEQMWRKLLSILL